MKIALVLVIAAIVVTIFGIILFQEGTFHWIADMLADLMTIFVPIIIGYSIEKIAEELGNQKLEGMAHKARWLYGILFACSIIINILRRIFLPHGAASLVIEIATLGLMIIAEIFFIRMLHRACKEM